MRVIIKKEIVKGEIEIPPGEYYFECSDGLYHKITVYQTEGITTDYILESVENYSDFWGIRCRKGWSDNDDNVPYKFSAFIREISGKKIEKETFEQQKQEVIKKLNE